MWCTWRHRPLKAIPTRAPVPWCWRCVCAVCPLQWSMAQPRASMATAKANGSMKRVDSNPKLPERSVVSTPKIGSIIWGKAVTPEPKCCAFRVSMPWTVKVVRRVSVCCAAHRCCKRMKMCTPTIYMQTIWPAPRCWHFGAAGLCGP